MSNTRVPVRPGLLSDDPRDGSDERPDGLDRERFSVYISELLDHVRVQSESTVLALVGDWGSGKSSVLEMLQCTLRERESWRVAIFNPWTYPDSTSLHRGFFNELAAALPKEDRPGSLREKIGDFAGAISPFGKLGGLVGLDAEGLIKAVGTIVAGDTSASAAKSSAEAALRQADVPILMIVDDLDRLTPDELLEVLKLVRLVGRLPNVYYLLSYDERTLLDVLRRTAVTGDDEERSRAYLEKIVQVRLDMPALRTTQRAKLLNEGLDKLGADVGLLLTSQDEQRLGDIYFSVLDRRLSTPRAITRFLGQIQAFYPLLHGEVDFVDFFLVNWLRTQEPGVYRMLQSYRDDLLGRDFSNFEIQRNAGAQQRRRKRWDERLRAARVQPDDLPGVIRVLSALFPEIDAAFEDVQHLAQARERSTPKAISHVDYFDRYVSFGVPQEDISDADVARAISDIAETAESPAISRFSDEIANETARAMRKLEQLRQAEKSLPEAALFDLIARTALRIDRNRVDIFDNPWRSAVRGGAACLMAMGAKQAVSAVERLGGTETLLSYIAGVARYLKSQDVQVAGERPPATFDPSEICRAVSAMIGTSLQANTAKGPFEDGATSNFLIWRYLDPDAAKAWITVQVDAGRWTMAETMGIFVTTSVPLGVPNPVPTIDDFQSSAVDEIFGIDRVLAELAPDLDAVGPVNAEPFEVAATPENCVNYALSRLKQQRDASAGDVP